MFHGGMIISTQLWRIFLQLLGIFDDFFEVEKVSAEFFKNLSNIEKARIKNLFTQVVFLDLISGTWIHQYNAHFAKISKNV